MSSRDLFFIGLVFSGSILTIVGALLISLYGYYAVIVPYEEADQSLIFWYLPILFAGVISCLLGIAAAVSGYRRLKYGRRQQ